MMIKGIGTDITERKRFNKDNEYFNNRFLSDEEIKMLKTYESEEAIDFLSGRWAAKEAIVKASNKEIIFSSIEILKSPSGAPKVYINKEIQENIKVSISHEKEYTIAFCVIENV